ncbi:hemH, partial [Symbiodinium microadriaticum]
AHGVPKSYIEAGDPYQSHIRCCAALISLRVKQKLQEKVDAATGGLSNMFWRKKVTIDVKLPGDTSSFSSPDKGEETLPLRCRLSFQSRVGPVEWLRPYTDDVLRDMGEKEGVQNLIVVPISFVSEHIETLEEIDIECMELAHKSGIKNWQRASALNTYDRFIRDLADMIEDAAD